MKFEKHDLSNGMKIPVAAMHLSGFGAHEATEYYTLKDTVAVLKKQMTALELIRAAWSLQQLAAELCTHLAMLCFPCEGCEDCCDEDGRCPYDALDFAVNFEVPDELLEKAGIPEDAPLHVELLDDGEITISMNHDSPGLWDVPAPMMQGFLAAGVCPSALEDVLEAGEIIYGA